ncbi:DUF1801 domain-containing protein [Tessaracoccus sp. HDW20]|uniref:DUF1801 domain-containing protein n=1 Tax=Tessaracoccus coleopterorum TaxID=2714950 RepID=UPI0018D2DE1A|nr:DUF1801 domain-containing protein [Tessaracoccus coleopterorum]NHB83645.1 DUF1801 domain-containing protein [Tessaracoccus coleopterorum]
MAEAVTVPTEADVEAFLEGVPERRRDEADVLIDLMRGISGEEPVMWGPSIIGFGSQHYRYETGREGDMPILGFSPRKARLTLYFDGWDRYSDQLARLGRHRLGVSCLYVNKLADVDLDVLREMLEACHARGVAADSPWPATMSTPSSHTWQPCHRRHGKSWRNSARSRRRRSPTGSRPSVTGSSATGSAAG